MAPIIMEFNDKNNLLFIIENSSITQTIPTDSGTDETIDFTDEVSKFLSSSKPQDIEHVNSLVINIVKAKNFSIFKYLLSHGYKIGVLNEKNQTALHLIFYNDWYKTRNPEMIDLSTKYISEVNFTDCNGLNHLHIASAIGNLQMVTYYLDKNEDIHAPYVTDVKKNEFDRSGFTPLHFAAFNSRLDIVNLLVERGANVNATDSAGRTPLHLVAHINTRLDTEEAVNLEIFKVLVNNKSNLNAKDNYGNTPLISIYNYMCYKKAEEPSVSPGESYKAVQAGRRSETFEFVMGFSPDVKVSNNNGDTILHCIINDLNQLRRPRDLAKISFDDSQHLKMLEQLLTFDKTIDVNAKNNQGETPLQLAVAYMSTDIVKFLLECNADLSGLKFDHENRGFFRYRNIVPDLEAVVHVLDIVESLENKGFKFTMEDNLTVLRFLVHEYKNCVCYSDDSPETDNVIIKIINILKCGSAKHVKLMLKKIEDELKPQSTLITRYDRRLLYIAYYRKYMKCADFYIDKEVEEAIDRLLQLNDVNQDGPVSEKMMNKVNCMKSTLLNENLTVYDVITQHPHNIYQYVFDKQFDYKFYNLDNFPGYAIFISGHFAKSLIRNYVEKVIEDYLKALLPLLPDLFYKTIVKYLNNEEVLVVAMAVAAM